MGCIDVVELYGLVNTIGNMWILVIWGIVVVTRMLL